MPPETRAMTFRPLPGGGTGVILGLGIAFGAILESLGERMAESRVWAIQSLRREVSCIDPDFHNSADVPLAIGYPRAVQAVCLDDSFT